MQIINTGGSSGGAVKSIQRGSTTSAQTVTINKVDMDKTMVLSVSKGSAGYVASRGNIDLHPKDSSNGGSIAKYSSSGSGYTGFVPYSGSITGGTTDLTVREYSAKLISATQLQCDGAVEWQVIEFN